MGLVHYYFIVISIIVGIIIFFGEIVNFYVSYFAVSGFASRNNKIHTSQYVEHIQAHRIRSESSFIYMYTSDFGIPLCESFSIRSLCSRWIDAGARHWVRKLWFWISQIQFRIPVDIGAQLPRTNAKTNHSYFYLQYADWHVPVPVTKFGHYICRMGQVGVVWMRMNDINARPHHEIQMLKWHIVLFTAYCSCFKRIF